MASLNLSTNGASISRSYQSIVNAPQPSGPAASSPTYGQWAVFSVSAPLVNAFQQGAGNKESILKVQSTGEGELIDLIEEFSDGRTQFAYVKVKDPNTGLPKNALIAWCGEGVPERTKGYFTSHLAAVAKLLHGYHVQVTARSDRDLNPEGIIQKVADSSGSRYSAGDAPPPVANATKPAVSSKPAFIPTQSQGVGSDYNRLNRTRHGSTKDTDVDDDGWGHDAPPVIRTQLEKVQSAYQPTKINMRDLTSQQQTSSTIKSNRGPEDTGPEVIRGAYQPVGKVDIAAIRRQAKESGSLMDDRPETVRGSYQPVGKVDIAAMRAKAQKPLEVTQAREPAVSSTDTGEAGAEHENNRPMYERASQHPTAERLTALPKPKTSNKFSGGTSLTGTKAPTPVGFGTMPAPSASPVGAASRTFADKGGKTPAQIWAEKKAREGGQSGSNDAMPTTGFSTQAPLASQTSGGNEWKSGYTGKSWTPIQTTLTGKSASSSIGQQRSGDREPPTEEEAQQSPIGGIGSIRDRFSGAPPMGAPAPVSNFDRSAPEPDVSNKPNRGRGIAMPGYEAKQLERDIKETPSLPTPPLQPRSPTPPTPDAREDSPIRVAMPVGRGAVTDAREEQLSPPPVMAVKSIELAGREADADDDEPEPGPDPARAAAQATVASSFGADAVDAQPGAGVSGKRAVVEYDYEKVEDNEVELKEGEYVTNIEMVDEDWWMGQNAAGEIGLFPSEYVKLVEDDESNEAAVPQRKADLLQAPTPSVLAAGPPRGSSKGVTATALFDYEGAEDNELSFPDGAQITNLEFPDDDWWLGDFGGQSGLFPANYVQLDK